MSWLVELGKTVKRIWCLNGDVRVDFWAKKGRERKKKGRKKGFGLLEALLRQVNPTDFMLAVRSKYMWVEGHVDEEDVVGYLP